MISVKTPEEIQLIKEGARILAGIMKKLEGMVQSGITTKDLDRVAQALILKSGAKPSFKDYQGFPAALCTSINEEIVHVAPSDKRILKQGDIISLDLGVFLKGFHSDMAITISVGKVAPEVLNLIEVTKTALRLGIKKAKIGNMFEDVSVAIQEYVESQGFNVVRELCGHGIGRVLHEDPQILNYVSPGKKEKIKIKEGMVFCLEPMVTVGDWRIKKTEDGYGYTTLTDGNLSAHFEHTMAATKKGCQVLTKLE